jgi:hypothetical protein
VRRKEVRCKEDGRLEEMRRDERNEEGKVRGGDNKCTYIFNLKLKNTLPHLLKVNGTNLKIVSTENEENSTVDKNSLHACLV